MKMNPKQAAKLLGCDAQTIREGIKSGELDIGAAWKKPGNKYYTYLIYEQKVREKVERA